MNIIFCRHAETIYNIEDKFQGASDSNLTARGIAQAESLNQYLLKHFQVKNFLISPAERVQKTFEILSRGMDVNVKAILQLQECCYGDWEEKVRSELDPEVLKSREQNKYTFVHPGSYKGIPGESYEQQYDRVKPILDGLDQYEGDLVIVGHRGTMMCIMKYYRQLTDQEAGSIKDPHNQIVIIDREHGVNCFDIDTVTNETL
jgi:broad specificity phosphatase PhoE